MVALVTYAQRITTSIRYSKNVLCVIILRIAVPVILREYARPAHQINIISSLGSVVPVEQIRIIAILASQIQEIAQSAMSNFTPRKEYALLAQIFYLDAPNAKAKILV